MTIAGNPASATVTSRDGLVRATVDSTGALTGLEFAPSAFEGTDPAALAETVLDVVRQGATRARQDEGPTAAPPSVPPRPTPRRHRSTRKV
ncbi:YbaB/EbfC family nucleoid-associated protein [Prauserella cavernicola]|uniref:YbaB/EbfC family nucleoid-associated protein n=1 Tax=Prauserella cavernicola TaxID=2800127 RepID=A0A934QSK7_9PSEU|nr:YbaB/EbfC family nucleoid-associated protein [Prauserella cavernicola]MBK1784589.1 YbaB/EbfC family nucleoid-associated protein [Prauserella cavernicola]